MKNVEIENFYKRGKFRFCGAISILRDIREKP